MITNLALKECGLKILPPGSLVYSTRASIGKIGIVKTPLVTNQGFTNLIPGKNLDVSYLAYTLKYFTPTIEKLGNTTTFKEVSRTAIRNFEIPLPPLSVQKHIADTLNKANALRKLDQELLKKFDYLSQSIFYETFGDLMQNSANAVNLSELVVINPSKPRLVLSNEKEVSFIPMEAVGEDGFLKRKYIRKLGDVIKGYTYFEEGDVLFAKITPCMENGKGAIVTNLVNGIGFGSTEFHVIRPSEHLTNRFIHTLLRLPSIRAEAEKQMTGSAGQKRVPKSFFENLSIVPPKFEKQIEFERRLNVIERGRENVLNSIDKSQNLFATLLQQYFS